ncbi:putative pre-mRNA-splicing factor CWC21 [Cercophora samala]|uniref:Pre-mRNA-splicing factor CWC21 n=1 Tax=Cercophora samala TaxID=330535 RepID=A0AA39ZMF1_9PEZI|nr:putative pre-mRNA-splicing factor CWC21 [Cercophora samala]
MSDNVGLSTPRGSGTSGYVQRNLAHPHHHHQSSRLNPYSRPPPPSQSLHTQRKPDQGLLDHDRKRQIEVKVFALRDELEEAGELTEEQIDEKCDELREKLKKEGEKGGVGPRRNIKSFQVHELADAKMKESERLRQALRISKDYEEGGHWRRQEERKRGGMGEGAEVSDGRQKEERAPPRERERRKERGGGREREGSRERYRERSPSGERYKERSVSRERYRERSVSQERPRGRGESRDRYRERSVSRDRYPDRRVGSDRDDYDDEDRGDRSKERDDRR